MGTDKTAMQREKLKGLTQALSRYFRTELEIAIEGLAEETDNPLELLSHSLEKSKYFLLGLFIEKVEIAEEKRQAIRQAVDLVYNFYLDILKRILKK